ncbi:cell wall-binding repeat-containing protein [Euzebya sp.]|uniref:cell wall-binding repeat-containing protein n=1 Tax=Euzebya sp. TaxID=1971409 RepID=UPI003513E149
MRARILSTASLLALIVATFGVTTVGAQTDGGAEDDGLEVRHVELAELNDSGVSGEATVVRDGDVVTILADVAGVAPALPHAQHLHGAPDDAGNPGLDAICPTGDADADGDGFVSTAEGAESYGGIQASLTTSGDTSADSGLAVERFPSPDGDAYEYVRSIAVPGDVADALDQLVVVVHGIDINGNGEYDAEAGQSSIDPSLPLEATIPAACGELAESDAMAHQAFLSGLNDSGAAGAATVVLEGTSAMVGIEGSGFAPGLPHAQHLHGVTDGSMENVCPPADADTDGDGFITTAEGQPFYDGINVSLTTEGDTSPDSALAVERFPVADEDGTYTYLRDLEVSEDVADALSEMVVVAHGIDINGNGEYDAEAGQSSIDPSLPLEATIPAVCGELTQADGGEMPGEGETDREIGRVAGDHRIGTAIAVSQRAFPDGAPVVYLSSQDVNPDALVGGVLTDGPILLVPATGDLPQMVADEIARVDPDQVLTLGGSATVSDEILVQAGNS